MGVVVGVGAGGLPQEVAGRLRGGVLAAFEVAVRSRFAAGGEARRRARDSAAAALQTAASHLQMLADGAAVPARPPARPPRLRLRLPFDF